MKRRWVRPGQALVALALGLVAGQLWLARDAGDDVAAPRDAVKVTAFVEPDVHLFGDTVDAIVEVQINTAVIEVGSVRPEIDFAPYDRAGAPRESRSTVGQLGVHRFVYPIRCLKEGCDATGNRGLVELPSARVAYRFRESGGTSFAPLEWPPFEVAGRVTDQDVELIRWRAAETSLSPVTTRIAPARAAVGALGLMVILLGAALMIVQRVWRPISVESGEVSEDVVRVSALTRAALAAESVSKRGDPAQTRRALERFALESTAAGRTELADEARALAWSSVDPPAQDVSELTRTALEGVS